MGGKNISRNDEADPKGGTVTFLGDPLEAGGEDVFESCQIKGGVIFDCYQTLIDIHTEEHRIETYETVSAWLAYHGGVKIKPEKLWDTYVFKVEERMKDSKEIYPEIRVEEIFAEICQENSIWKIDEKSLGGIETSRVFRAASIRKLRPLPSEHKTNRAVHKHPKVHNLQRAKGLFRT